MSNGKSAAFRMVLAIVMLTMSSSIAVLGGTAHKGSGSSHPAVKAGKNAKPATLTATLIDPMANAKEKTATVQVQVGGVKLIDPAMTNKKPTTGQGHLHYRVDDGPVIATTTTKLSFHELTPGKHKILIMLANNDHSPAGPEQTLEVTIP